VKRSPGARRSKNAAVFVASRGALATSVALLGALIAPGCAAILGANKSYYEVDGGGGSAATTLPEPTSSAVTSGGWGGSGGSGGAPFDVTTASATSSAGTGGAPNDTCWHGDPADPGGVDPCGATTLAALADNFDDNQVGPLWTVYTISGTALEMDQHAVVSVPGGPGKFAGFVSKAAYSLLGCHGAIEVVQSPQHPSTVVHMSLSPDPSIGDDLAEVRQIDKSLAFSLVVGGVATDDCVIPYSPISHRFWRVRETGGYLLWETTPNATAGTVQRRAKTPPFAAAVRVDFGVIPIAADLPGVGIFDNFDLP
jgi:hypothetical protein